MTTKLVVTVTIHFVTINMTMTMQLKKFLPYRLSRLSEAVSNDIRPVYKDLYGLNRPEWRVLAALAEIGPATATSIGAHSAQHKTKVSRAVFALEQRRWLNRTGAESDRRTALLALTKLGRQAYDTLAAPLLAREAAILGRLSPADRASLLEILDKCEHAFLPKQR